MDKPDPLIYKNVELADWEPIHTMSWVASLGLGEDSWRAFRNTDGAAIRLLDDMADNVYEIFWQHWIECFPLEHRLKALQKLRELVRGSFRLANFVIRTWNDIDD